MGARQTATRDEGRVGRGEIEKRTLKLTTRWPAIFGRCCDAFFFFFVYDNPTVIQFKLFSCIGIILILPYA